MKTQKKNCKLSPHKFSRKKEQEKEHADAQMSDINQSNGQAMEDMTEEITLTIILNRISGGKYKHPNEFWMELGKMFKMVNINYPDDSLSFRKISDRLRVLAYHLYVSQLYRAH